MKLKSILILTMVAIMAIAGSAFAIETATVGAGADIGGTTFLHTPPTVALFNAADTLGATVGASGTGFTGGMPAQVAYNPNAVSLGNGQYTAGVGPTSGYVLNAALFGMCGGATNTTATCSKFIPTGLVFDFTSAATLNANYLGATGGDGTQLYSTVPVGTGNFNQGTFSTGLVSGISATGVGVTPVSTNLSQKTMHHSAPAGTADGDYIDQRLAQTIGTSAQGQTLRQAVVAQAGSGGTVAANVSAGALDASWVGNPDNNCVTAATRAACMNTGVVGQAVGDNMGLNVGGVDTGSYGQLFNSSDTLGTNTITPLAVTSAVATYNSIIAGGTFPVPVGSLP